MGRQTELSVTEALQSTSATNTKLRSWVMKANNVANGDLPIVDHLEALLQCASAHLAFTN